MTPQELTAALASLWAKLTGIDAQLHKAQSELQPKPRLTLTDFRIPPHMRYRLRRVVGR